MGVEVTSVSWFRQLTVKTVENVVLTSKGVQDRNIQLLDGTTVENKGKLIPISSQLCYVTMETIWKNTGDGRTILRWILKK